MKRKIMRIKRIDLFQWIVNVSSVVALILQCLNIQEEPWKSYIPYIAYAVILLLLICIIKNIFTRVKTEFTRPELIQLTKSRMINSTGKIVMFGGDLSWAEDYVDTITEITDNSQTVEIFFPLDIIANSKASVIKGFEKRANQLKKAGATIYATPEDYHLRCTLIDIDMGQENNNLCVISSKRIFKNTGDSGKNKYEVNVLKNAIEEDRSMCSTFYRNYCLIKQLSKKY